MATRSGAHRPKALGGITVDTFTLSSADDTVTVEELALAGPGTADLVEGAAFWRYWQSINGEAFVQCPESIPYGTGTPLSGGDIGLYDVALGDDCALYAELRDTSGELLCRSDIVHVTVE